VILRFLLEFEEKVIEINQIHVRREAFSSWEDFRYVGLKPLGWQPKGKMSGITTYKNINLDFVSVYSLNKARKPKMGKIPSEITLEPLAEVMLFIVV